MWTKEAASSTDKMTPFSIDRFDARMDPSGFLMGFRLRRWMVLLNRPQNELKLRQFIIFAIKWAIGKKWSVCLVHVAERYCQPDVSLLKWLSLWSSADLAFLCRNYTTVHLTMSSSHSIKWLYTCEGFSGELVPIDRRLSLDLVLTTLIRWRHTHSWQMQLPLDCTIRWINHFLANTEKQCRLLAWPCQPCRGLPSIFSG